MLKRLDFLRQMSDNKKTPKDKKKTSEKPVSLFGAKFEDVLAALLKTPKPEKEEGAKDDEIRK